MSKITISLLVTKELGYCCEFGFFRRYDNTALIAERLGISERAIRYRKELIREGKIKCAKCSGCVDAKLKAAGR